MKEYRSTGPVARCDHESRHLDVANVLWIICRRPWYTAAVLSVLMHENASYEEE